MKRVYIQMVECERQPSHSSRLRRSEGRGLAAMIYQKSLTLK